MKKNRLLNKKSGLDWLALFVIMFGLIIAVIIILYMKSNNYSDMIQNRLLKPKIMFIHSFWGLVIFLIFGGISLFLQERYDLQRISISPLLLLYFISICGIFGFIGMLIISAFIC